MAVTLNPFTIVNNYLNKYQDSRTANWFLMSSPFYTLGICLSYVYIVKVWGPRLMENRKPFQLRKVLVIYNFLQVIFSLWLFYQIGMGGWFTGEYSLKCQPVDYSNKPSTVRMVHASWWYYFSKYTEFIDTLFFVLRKKYDQVSTLHVIHHGIMPMSVWFGVKYTPGGHSTFFGFLNTFVHIIMYTYYMLSALGPGVQKYLWWKKYLTTLQMAQFVGIMAHAFQLLFIDCNYPRAFVWWIGMHAVMFFYLFKDFYRQTYHKLTRSTSAFKSNGEVKKNGYVQNGQVKENGSYKQQNGVSHSVTKSLSEYYINSTSEVHHRIPPQ